MRSRLLSIRSRVMTAAATASVALLSACAAPDAAVAPTSLAARPAPATSIAMTVRDVTASGAATQIMSDGLGEYVDGQLGMQVQIDQYGNLQIGPTDGGTTTPQRSLRFDYSAPVDPANGYRPASSGQLNFRFVSNKSATGAPAIQDLGVNGNPASACYALTVAQRNSATHHRDVFNTAIDAGATFVFVTRTATSPAQWTIESANAACGANANVAALYSQDLVKKNAPLVFRGHFFQRFALVLRAL